MKYSPRRPARRSVWGISFAVFPGSFCLFLTPSAEGTRETRGASAPGAVAEAPPSPCPLCPAANCAVRSGHPLGTIFSPAPTWRCRAQTWRSSLRRGSPSRARVLGRGKVRPREPTRAGQGQHGGSPAGRAGEGRPPSGARTGTGQQRARRDPHRFQGALRFLWLLNS